MERGKKFRVNVMCVACQSFEVLATDEESAIKKVTNQYEDCDKSILFDPNTNYDVIYNVEES